MSRPERRKFEAQMRTRVKRLPFCGECRRPKKPGQWDAGELENAYCTETCDYYHQVPRPVENWPPGSKRRKKGRS